MAERGLPKAKAGVRFSSPAPLISKRYLFMKNTAYINSAIGIFEIVEEDGFIVKLDYYGKGRMPKWKSESSVLSEALSQLEEYFKGERRIFDLPLKLSGTDFQKKCWDALLEIPYGEVCSYQDIAKKVGNIKAVRAVGGANHNNPAAIVVPCHRVIGKDGSLTGYGGGLHVKEFLLNLERQSLKG